MKAGKCPICKQELNIYKSLEIEDWKRYDVRCNTNGCLINGLEWNYLERKELLNLIKSSQAMAKIKEKKPEVIHFNIDDKSGCGRGSKMTKNKKHVTCGNCFNNLNFKGK